MVQIDESDSLSASFPIAFNCAAGLAPGPLHVVLVADKVGPGTCLLLRLFG